MTEKQRTGAVIVFILFVAALLNNTCIIYLNVSGSLPRGLYLRIPIYRECFRQGDIVVYEPTEEVKSMAVKRKYSAPDGLSSMTFMKPIGALSGDSYTLSAKTLVLNINGRFVGKAERFDSYGQELPLMIGNHTVKNGEFLPISTYAVNSFDGRYTGTVPIQNIKARVIPLVVEC
ncbi:MAG: S26 family signal peptidase [Alphaproteobacteria bacterium]|nr:S26 family signal peptidase [Alphaproteobacteria bacterium]